MPLPKIFISEISDPYIRKNFENLNSFLAAQGQLLDFQFLELDFTQAETERPVRHRLNVIPRDLVRLEISGAGKVTFHRGLFDRDFIYVSSTGVAHVRLLVGLHKSDGAFAVNEDAIEEWRATV